MKSITVLVLALGLTACGGHKITITDQINAAAEGRALEKMAEKLSSQPGVTSCSLYRLTEDDAQSVNINCY